MIDLGRFVNAADISAADAPHVVVEKLQRAIDKAAPSATYQPIAAVLSWHGGKVRWARDSKYLSAGTKLYVPASETEASSAVPESGYCACKFSSGVLSKSCEFHTRERTRLVDALNDAVLAERKACAAIAEARSCGLEDSCATPDFIADEIRARGDA